MSTVRLMFANGEKLTSNANTLRVSGYISKLINNLEVKGDNSDSESDSDKESKNKNKHTANSKSPTIDIPLDSITPETMKLIISWCNHYLETNKAFNNNSDNSNELSKSYNNIPVGTWSDNSLDEYISTQTSPILDNWERDFLHMDSSYLQDLLMAANFLDIEPLIDSICSIIADQLRGKSPQEVVNAIRSAHNVVNLT